MYIDSTMETSPILKERLSELNEIGAAMAGETNREKKEKLEKAYLETLVNSKKELKEYIEPEEFKTETLSDLLLADLPKAKWLVKDILPIEGFCFIFGPEATGKTFYTLSLADSVAYKRPWLDKFEVFCETPVLIIDKENTRSTIQSRIKGLSISDPDGKIHRVLYPEKLQLKSDDGKSYSPLILTLSEKVKKLGIGLLIVDAFTDMMMGNANAREETQVFFEAFRELFPGICILVLAHTNKAAGFVRTAGEKLSGNRNIAAQLYTSFLVEPAPKTRNEFIFEQTKARDSLRLPKFRVNLVSQIDPLTGESYVEKIMYAGEVIDEDIKMMEAVAAISDLLSSQPRFIKEELRQVCQKQDISERTMNRALAQMELTRILGSAKDAPPHANRKVFFRPVKPITPEINNYWNSEQENDD